MKIGWAAPANLSADRLKEERIKDEQEAVMEVNSSGSNALHCPRSDPRIAGWI
jgi:hypothetical protein